MPSQPSINANVERPNFRSFPQWYVELVTAAAIQLLKQALTTRYLITALPKLADAGEAQRSNVSWCLPSILKSELNYPMTHILPYIFIWPFFPPLPWFLLRTTHQESPVQAHQLWEVSSIPCLSPMISRKSPFVLRSSSLRHRLTSPRD